MMNRPHPDENPASILLVSVNARYSHCSFAVRTLKANLGALSAATRIMESDLVITPLQLAAQICGLRPQVVGFSAYLWNIRLIEAAARILRITAPEMRLVVGGPEITADYPGATLFDLAITGEGESTLRAFCTAALATPASARDSTTVPVAAPPEDTANLSLPYDLYSESDLAHRTIYVEASRGCPYACAYCTSAESGLRLIPLARLLPALEKLWRRGLRRYKFLDRSFNAAPQHACAILDFFLERCTSDTSLHFEINPATLHQSLKERIAAFPPGALHLEVGIQTLNPAVAAAIGRCDDIEAALDNLHFLTRETGAAVHADLIFGLPGEDEASFAAGFNRLVCECAPPELQVNLLKGLPGTRLARQAATHGLAFNPEPPYELLRSDAMDFATLSRLQNFARCWELVHNRGHFPAEIEALMTRAAGDPWTLFQGLTRHLLAAEGKMFAIARPRLGALLQEFLHEG